MHGQAEAQVVDEGGLAGTGVAGQHQTAVGMGGLQRAERAGLLPLHGRLPLSRVALPRPASMRAVVFSET